MESGVEEGEGEDTGYTPTKEDPPSSEALVGSYFLEQRAAEYPLNLSLRRRLFRCRPSMCLISHELKSCSFPVDLSVFVRIGVAFER